jgi:hypothetical protein
VSGHDHLEAPGKLEALEHRHEGGMIQRR